MLWSSLDNGLLASTFNVGFSRDLELYCFHGEGEFEQFPHHARSPSCHNRMGNIHHVLRTFGVDASATAAARGHEVRAIKDTRLKYFFACGVNGFRPAFSINLDK